MKLENLKKTIPYKWKLNSFNYDKTKGACVGYVDARDVMDLLDEVVGAENWKDEYKYENNQWLCGISIRCGTPELGKNGEWVTKWDTGTAGDIETEKSAISDAFKRAGVKWGIGRFLYDLEIKWIDVKNKKPVDKQGNRIWDLTKHFSKPIVMITTDQKDKIDKLVTSRGRTISEVCKIGKIKSIDELTSERANKLIKHLTGLPESTLQ